MTRILPPIIGLMAAVLTFQIMDIEAYCARCAKIEGDRAKEQAENPVPLQYYDDQKNVHKGKDSNVHSKGNAAQNDSDELALSELPASASHRTFGTQQQAANHSLPQTGNQNPDVSPVDQFTPSSSGEDAFIQNSQNRMNRLNEQNLNMIKNDRQMLKEGYDPNEVSPQYRTPVKDQNLQTHWNPPNGQKSNE